MKTPEPCTLVIFGASGDLTRRKLIPALFDLYLQERLPRPFTILGVSRTEFGDDDFRHHIRDSLKSVDATEAVPNTPLDEFIHCLFYHRIDTERAEDYQSLKTRLQILDRDRGTRENVIYYLSTPPSLYGKIPDYLGQQRMTAAGSDGGWKRLIVEKPFGYDLESARELNKGLYQHFDESQIYRIDHYLGKETVQNILAFRFANGIFEPLWNRHYIQHVEITAAESVGVEKRARYYDHSGALRDMIQNHLLQILATIAMEPPSRFESVSVRNETVKVLQAVCPFSPDTLEHNVVRAQYTASTVNGEPIAAYRQEENVPADSNTETFVALKLFVDNWRWGGIPFYIRTGKRLPTRATEVVIHFQKTPHRLFKEYTVSDGGCNQLVIRIQPDEGILLKFGMKVPGTGFDIQNVNMDFRYSDLAASRLPTAYERLLLDCMLGDATLYARADAVEASWKIVTPILQGWAEPSEIPLYGYPAGSWGPREAQKLFEDPQMDWRYPCESLVSEDKSRKL